MIEYVRNFISHIASSEQEITLELKGDQIYMSDSYSNNHKLFFYEPLNSVLKNNDIEIQNIDNSNKFNLMVENSTSWTTIGNIEIINKKALLFILAEKKFIDATSILHLLEYNTGMRDTGMSFSFFILNNIRYRCHKYKLKNNDLYCGCSMRSLNNRVIEKTRVFNSVVKSLNNEYPLIYIEDENNLSIKLINSYENITLEKSFNFKDDIQNELDNIILTINSFSSSFNVELNQESYIDFNYNEGKILLSPNFKFNIEQQVQEDIFNYLKENINMTNRGLFNSICRSLFNNMDDNTTIDTLDDLYNYKKLQEIVDV